MKDLVFYGENTVNRSGGVIRVQYRTDLIHSSAQNFTVMQVTGLDEMELSNNILENKLAKEFKKLPYTLEAFKQFAEDNYLELSIQNSDGSESEVLVEGYGSDSVPGDESWFD